VTFVERPEDAEAILILGSNAPETTLDDYRELFRGLTIPAICCNPDKLLITSTGLWPAPGAIADVYEKMGGKVQWIGKPYRTIYDYALKIIKRPRRVLCIGDSAEHDVAGGEAELGVDARQRLDTGRSQLIAARSATRRTRAT
jgi:HAD superfamily hydrolase (TIGR01459 family)